MEEKLVYHYTNRYFDHGWEIEGNLNDTIYDLYKKGELEFENLNCKFIIYQDSNCVIFLHVIQYGPFAIELDIADNVTIEIEIKLFNDYLSTIKWPKNNDFDNELRNELEHYNNYFKEMIMTYLRNKEINEEAFKERITSFLDQREHCIIFCRKIFLNHVIEGLSFDLKKWKIISKDHLSCITEIMLKIIETFKHKEENNGKD